MAIQRPDKHPIAHEGPWGNWQETITVPDSTPKDPDVSQNPPGPQNPAMEVRLAKLESVVGTLATKSDVEGVRTDLSKMDASIVRWMLATVIGLFLGFAGLFFTMQNSINGALDRVAKAKEFAPQPEKHSQPQAPPIQPIVIQLPQTVSFPSSGPQPVDAQDRPTKQ